MSTAAERAKRRRARMTPQQRTQERTYYAKKRRDDLIRALAPDLTCARSGCGFRAQDPAELVVDHVDGKAWHARSRSSHNRVARYWREFKAGVPMRALCHACSERDGAHRRHGRTLEEAAGDEAPF